MHSYPYYFYNRSSLFYVFPNAVLLKLLIYTVEYLRLDVYLGIKF
jgi:hypothetical protein